MEIYAPSPAGRGRGVNVRWRLGEAWRGHRTLHRREKRYKRGILRRKHIASVYGG
jgi:hypothetical protein